MSIIKPLLEDEVPEEHRYRIEFGRQWQSHLFTGERIKKRTVIPVECTICRLQNIIPVNDIRNWVRGQRRGPFPGDHRGCKYAGQYKTKEGYIWIWSPDHPKAYDGKYVPQHILIMEESLGRYLDRESESVHHINGNRIDNRIENLQLRKRYHGKGQAWECQDCGSHNVVAVELKDATIK